MIFSILAMCLWLLCVRLDQVTNYMSDNEIDGDAESVSSGGFRGEANYYTGADDKVGCLIYVTYFSFSPLFPLQRILQFIVENGRCEDTGGIVLWQLMEERQVAKRRSCYFVYVYTFNPSVRWWRGVPGSQ